MANSAAVVSLFFIILPFALSIIEPEGFATNESLVYFPAVGNQTSSTRQGKLFPFLVVLGVLINAASAVPEIIKHHRAKECCVTIYDEYCADGTKGTPYCGYRSCNGVACHCGECRSGWYATIHEKTYQRGVNFLLVGGKSCQNLQHKLCYFYYQGFPPVRYEECVTPNDWISSINTHDNCVRVYEHGNCQGVSMRVGPGEGCHGNMQDCRMWDGGPTWNDQISSIGPC